MAQKYIAPVPQGTSRGFGNGHNGIDYLTPMGTPVKASGDGVVEFEGQGEKHSWITWMGGITILLRHDDGFSGYSHLSRSTVNKGDVVKQGQVIGYSGNTGNVLPKPTSKNPNAGSHLHFDFLPLVPDFKNGYSGRVNPESYLSKTEGGEEMIQDTDNEYGRWNKLAYQIRGRGLTRDEFRNAAVGRTWLNAIEILSDDPEADATTRAQEIGQLAIRDNWEGQIHSLVAQLKALPADTSEAEKKLAAFKEALKGVLDTK